MIKEIGHCIRDLCVTRPWQLAAQSVSVMWCLHTRLLQVIQHILRLAWQRRVHLVIRSIAGQFPHFAGGHQAQNAGNPWRVTRDLLTPFVLC